ncbi:MAG: molecular chaperone TorD family protein [Myxococcota bacterium]
MKLSLAERAPVYVFAADLLLRELDTERVRWLATPAIASVLDEAAPGCAAWLDAPFSADREREVRSEFARLFLLPGGIPPFASAWLEGEREALGAQLATLVNRALEALGRTPQQAEPWGTLPLDHAALLLDLVARAATDDDARVREVASHLEHEALTPWLGRFAEALGREAICPPYIALGSLLATLHPTIESNGETASA